MKLTSNSTLLAAASSTRNTQQDSMNSELDTRGTLTTTQIVSNTDTCVSNRVTQFSFTSWNTNQFLEHSIHTAHSSHRGGAMLILTVPSETVKQPTVISATEHVTVITHSLRCVCVAI